MWGHVNLYAVGAGQAVAQLDVTYGVDYEPFKVCTVIRKSRNLLSRLLMS